MITFLSLIGSAVIGVIAAWLAGRLMRGNGFGLFGDIIAGVLGAVIGGYALRMAGLNLGSGLAARLIVAFIAATGVLFLVHMFTSRRDGHRSWS
ncbi:MAG TPA: GlsB/YeaQ/YmgE family stress response membrane protein [Thermoanaerobaculia bacterium]|nr:GlsB/YeaQ/YmgE family stress response membrane protein [Thermoanaerobaculia bacterium]